MFTGIIKYFGIVEENKLLSDGSSSLKIKLKPYEDKFKTSKEVWGFFDDIKIGDSIAINGICLTVVNIDVVLRVLSFFVSKETISNTTILTIPFKSYVNVELAMSASDRFGGHIVSGHVDEVIKLTQISKLGDSNVLTFEISPKNSGLIIKKGSVAIDGVSLTINSVVKNTFEVCIIPHTWSNTTLCNLDPVSNFLCNVEYDYFTKIINKNLKYYLNAINNKS
jgi:riboflavin synthase